VGHVEQQRADPLLLQARMPAGRVAGEQLPVRGDLGAV
jgi:hypothetical protein